MFCCHAAASGFWSTVDSSTTVLDLTWYTPAGCMPHPYALPALASAPLLCSSSTSVLVIRAHHTTASLGPVHTPPGMEPEPEGAATPGDVVPAGEQLVEEVLRRARLMWHGADEWWWFNGGAQDQPVPYSADFSRKLTKQLAGSPLGVRVATPCGKREVGRGESGWRQFVVLDPRRSRRVEQNPHKSPTLAD
eukprot:COSAG01_NODE_24841_length_764_cov_1.533835_1_plen_191_part_10